MVEYPTAATDALLRTLAEDLGTAGLDPHALLVRQHGVERLRAHWAPFRIEDPALVYSVSKTFTSLAIGLLIEDGLVDLDAPVATYLNVPNPWTVRDLLTMSTGHSREQTLAIPFDARTLLTTPPDGQRGTFAYNSPASYVLAEIVRAVSGGDLTDLLAPRLLDAVGAEPVWWRDLDDRQQGFSGLHARVTDLARIGQLLLDEGSWDGRQVLPPTYLAQLRTPQVATADSPRAAGPGHDDESDPAVGDWGRGYGLHVWSSKHGYRLDGAFGQFVLVIPERDLVIAYLGASDTAQAALDLFWRFVESLAPETRAQPGAEPGAEPGAGLDLVFDSWSARGQLLFPPDLGLDTTGWSLADAAPGGACWDLALPIGGGAPQRIRVRADRWTRTRLNTRDHGEADTLVLAARGELREDATVVVHLAVPTSPHRIRLERTPGGQLDARWHTAPLWQPDLTTLLTPHWLTPPTSQETLP